MTNIPREITAGTLGYIGFGAIGQGQSALRIEKTEEIHGYGIFNS